MTLKGQLGAAAIACVLAGGLAAIPAKPAGAQGLFQGFFGGAQYRNAPRGYAQPRYRRDARRFDRRGYERRRSGAPAAWGGYRRQAAPPPRVRVSSPRYFTYKADALKAVSLASLAEFKIASTQPLSELFSDSPFTEARRHLVDIKMRALPEVGDALVTHYACNPEFVWITDGAVNARGKAAVKALQQADRFGLAPEDYVVELPAEATDGEAADRSRDLIAFEMALTAKVMGYVLDATRGRVDPNRISGYHDFARKTVDLGGALQTISAADDVSAALAKSHPAGAHFQALVDELATLREAADEAPEVVEVAAGTFLKPGASNPELANVVAAIRQVASDALKETHAETLANYKDEPVYTPELVTLVKDFQTEAGLTADGIVGKNTIRAMVPVTPAAKIAKVELAMERARWLPSKLGLRHVFINQPAFTATYHHQGKEPLTMRTVIGKKSNQTNFFMDKVEIVEYNPYWGVPRSIIVNEMVPKLYSDPSYLDRAGYEVTTVSGRRVSSSSVDWHGVATKRVGINVRQPPGRGNALGAVKILFPNKHAIYMHDTPHKKLFGKDVRAFSHGCVRLQDPREMAAAVLNKTKEYVDRRIAEGRNDKDLIDVDLPVYVAYFTAWPNEDGTVEYFHDIYDRDMYLTRAVERTKATRHAEG